MSAIGPKRTCHSHRRMSAFCEKRMLCKAQGYRGVMSVAVFETDPQFAGDSSFSHKLDYLDSCAPAIKFPFLLRLRIMFQRRRMTNETRWHLKAPCCRSDTDPKGRHLPAAICALT